MEKKITAAIVDDEQGNRENLLRMISGYCPQVEVTAVCSSVAEARQALSNTQPDILFLDIRLGDDTSFSLLESLPEILFEVIFVTAYDSYAIQAIRFSALDYLLKPIDPKELANAVDKAIEVILRKQENNRMRNLLRNAHSQDKHKKIALSVADKIEFVEIDSIVRCEAESNYTTFYLKSGERLIVSKTLKEFDELLTPYNFLRVHQSHLINLDEIKSFIKSDGGYIRMKDGSSISISRQRRNYVMEILKQL
ncbi:LytR/AlgR family response regulator transcription factor [Parabacteroides sp.]